MSEKLYLEDLHPGQKFASHAEQITEAAIKEFAEKFDPQPFHLDNEAAKSTLFGGLAASGWHTAAFTMRLNVTSGPKLAGGIIGGGGEINWPTPVRPAIFCMLNTKFWKLPRRAPGRNAAQFF